MTIYEVLRRQYRDISALFDQVYGCLASNREELARTAFQILSVKLVAGIRAEHAVVYPRFAAVGLSAAISTATREIIEIEGTINHLRLVQLPSGIDTAYWRRILGLLQRQVDRHVDTLEEDILPSSEGALLVAEAEDIACDFLLYEPLQTTIAGPSLTFRQPTSLAQNA